MDTIWIFFDNKTANHLHILRLSIFELTLEKIIKKKHSLLSTPLKYERNVPEQGTISKGKDRLPTIMFEGYDIFFSGGVLSFILSIFFCMDCQRPKKTGKINHPHDWTCVTLEAPYKVFIVPIKPVNHPKCKCG